MPVLFLFYACLNLSFACLTCLMPFFCLSYACFMPFFCLSYDCLFFVQCLSYACLMPV